MGVGMPEKSLQEEVNDLARLYGLRGLEVALREGGGSACELTERGLAIVFDTTEAEAGDDVEAKALYTLARELSRAFEAVTYPAFARAGRKKPRWERFFYDQIDFTAIDRGNRRIPAVDRAVAAVYRRLPHRLSGLPGDVQLLYALRFSQVEPEAALILDPEVEAALKDLRRRRAGALCFDVPAVLADPSTRVDERRRLADIFVKPLFLLLKKKARQRVPTPGLEAPGGGQKSPDGQPPERADDAPEEEESADEEDEKTGEGNEIEEKENFGDQLRDLLVSALEQPGGALQESRPADLQKKNLSKGEENIAFVAVAGEKTLALPPADARQYAQTLDRLRPLIQKIAAVFLRLSGPREGRASPRYARQASLDGVRLHPRTLQEAAIQSRTGGIEAAVWQGINKNGRRRTLDFGGLDCWFFADVSGSMEGEKARCAADAAVCLVEGLQYAARAAARKNRRERPPPDIRLEIAAFGAGFDVIAPLSRSPQAAQKGRAFVSLLNAESRGTYLAAALDHVRCSIEKMGKIEKAEKRRKLLFVISDGRFHDAEAAQKAAAQFPRAVRIKQVFIGEPGVSLGGVSQTISSPQELPRKLYELLKAEISDGM